MAVWASQTETHKGVFHFSVRNKSSGTWSPEGIIPSIEIGNRSGLDGVTMRGDRQIAYRTPHFVEDDPIPLLIREYSGGTWGTPQSFGPDWDNDDWADEVHFPNSSLAVVRGRDTFKLISSTDVSPLTYPPHPDRHKTIEASYGDLWIFWGREIGGYSNIHSAFLVGSSWSKVQPVFSRAPCNANGFWEHTVSGLALAIAPDNRVWAAYIAWEYCTDWCSNYVFVVEWNGSRWEEPVIAVDAIPGVEYAEPDVDFDNEGGAHLLWTASLDNGLPCCHYAYAPPGGWFSSPEMIDSSASWSCSAPRVVGLGGRKALAIWSSYDVHGDDAEIVYSERSDEMHIEPTATPTQEPTPDPMVGDLNNDHWVGYQDLIILQNKWHSRP